MNQHFLDPDKNSGEIEICNSESIQSSSNNNKPCQIPLCRNTVYGSCQECSIQLCWNHFIDQTPCYIAHKNRSNLNVNQIPVQEIEIQETSETELFHLLNDNGMNNSVCKIPGCAKEFYRGCNICSVSLCSQHYREDISCHISHQSYFADQKSIEKPAPKNTEADKTPVKETEKKKEPRKRENKKLIAKTNRIHGKEYFSVHSKKLVPERTLKKRCNGASCAKYGRQCNKLEEDWRQKIFQDFYSLDSLQKQREYINRYCTKTLKKKSTVGAKSVRKFSCFFFLPGLKLERFKVCRKTFLNTLCISEKFYRTAVDKLKPTGIIEGERRGGRQKSNLTLDLAKRRLIETHISRFPRDKSNCLKADNAKEYLPAGLTIKKMYDMLIAEINDEQQKPSLALYRKIFKSKNLSFHSPTKNPNGSKLNGKTPKKSETTLEPIKLNPPNGQISSNNCIAGEQVMKHYPGIHDIIPVNPLLNRADQTCHFPLCTNTFYNTCSLCSLPLCWNHYVDQTPCYVAHKFRTNFNVNPTPPTVPIQETSMSKTLPDGSVFMTILNEGHFGDIDGHDDDIIYIDQNHDSGNNVNNNIIKTCEIPGCQKSFFHNCNHCPIALCSIHYREDISCHISHQGHFAENIVIEQTIQKDSEVDKIPDKIEKPVPVKTKGRKRENKKLIAKNNRIHGKEYYSVYSKKFVPGKALKERCNGSICAKYSRQCIKLEEKWREKIFQDFYSLDSLHQQREYINRYCTKTLKKKSTVGEKSVRQFSCYFYLPNENSERLRVCRQTFLNTLCISEKFYRTAIDKLTPTGIVEGERRGGRQKPNLTSDQAKRKLVEAHINRFPRIKSNSCHTITKREYLPADLTVKKMHDMLLEELVNEPIKPSLALYRKMLKSKNLSFLPRKKSH